MVALNVTTLSPNQYILSIYACQEAFVERFTAQASCHVSMLKHVRSAVFLYISRGSYSAPNNRASPLIHRVFVCVVSGYFQDMMDGPVSSSDVY